MTGCETCGDHYDPASDNHCPICHQGPEGDGQGWILTELDAAAAEWEQMPDEYKPVIVADYWPIPQALAVKDPS